MIQSNVLFVVKVSKIISNLNITRIPFPCKQHSYLMVHKVSSFNDNVINLSLFSMLLKQDKEEGQFNKVMLCDSSIYSIHTPPSPTPTRPRARLMNLSTTESNYILLTASKNFFNCMNFSLRLELILYCQKWEKLYLDN